MVSILVLAFGGIASDDIQCVQGAQGFALAGLVDGHLHKSILGSNCSDSEVTVADGEVNVWRASTAEQVHEVYRIVIIGVAPFSSHKAGGLPIIGSFIRADTRF